MIIAVDGQAGSGKGTLACGLAAHFDYAYLDTGIIYRALGYKASEQGVSFENEDELAQLAISLDEKEFSDPQLRSEEVAVFASKVSLHPKVRQALLHYQQNFAQHPPKGKKGAVLDGRDIGTIICPHADIKIFVTASLEQRAKRRIKDLQIRGIKSNLEQILADMNKRDIRDSERSQAPMKAAVDAWLLDTSDMNIQQALDACIAHICSKII